MKKIAGGGDCSQSYCDCYMIFLRLTVFSRALCSFLIRKKPALEVDPVVKEKWKRAGVKDEDQWVCAPGLRWLKIGKSQEGYWTNDHMLVHLVDMVDVFDVLYGKESLEKPWSCGYECKAKFHFDWLSGHGAFKDGALNETAMSAKWGGGQAVPHDTEIKEEAGYLGPYPAMMKVGNKVVDCKLKKGQTQKGFFDDNTMPPFYDPKKAPGDGKRTEAVVTSRDYTEFAALEDAIARSTECVTKLQECAWDFTSKTLTCPLLRAFIRIRRPVPEGLKAHHPFTNRERLNSRCILGLERLTLGV